MGVLAFNVYLCGKNTIFGIIIVRKVMKFLFAGVIFLLLAAACRENKNPDVSQFRKERKILRLEQDLFALNAENPDIKGIYDKYGRYFDVYAEGVLRLGNVSDSAFGHLLSLFLRDTIIREVYDTVAFKYPDMKAQEKDLSEAFAYYAYYFPGRTIPQVYTHISGFNQSVVVDSAVIGVSLDNYLGDCVFYSMLSVPVPMYARANMTGDYIVRDLLSGWLSAEHSFSPQKNDLISGMVYQGKIIYLLRKLLPQYEFRRILGFTQEQLEWCENNEKQIWGFFVENKYLFSTQQKLILKYLNDAPYTSGMPSESPGRTTAWTGFKIVEAYMEKSGLTPEELVNEQDYHKILRVAAYRP